jgi:tetratricopeptide (TPR) repeat protein
MVETLVREVAAAGFKEAAVSSLLGEALRQLGKRDEARTVLEEGLAQHPGNSEIEARLGCVFLDLDEPLKAIELLGRVRKARPRDPQVLTYFAGALLRVGRAEEAEAQLARAMLVGGGADTRLVLAMVKLRRGLFDDADRLAALIEGGETAPMLVWTARALRADVKLLRGDARGAFDSWRKIEAAGHLEPHQIAHMAYAGELAGERALVDAAIARRVAADPQAEDLLVFAQIANLRGEPARALELLVQADAMSKVPNTGWDFEFHAARGRALRLLLRPDEARAELQSACALPEASMPRIGAGPFVDLGHLAAEAGVFEEAEVHFRRALELDPEEPEAKKALELTSRRLGWRQALEASAEERVDAANAQAEALRRRFLVRETEVDRLKREVERLKADRASAEAKAQAATQRATELQSQSPQQLRAELEERERDIEGKANENLERAFAEGRIACPERLRQMLQVAERTYQKSLYMELPAAAVAVLFSGAFERSLVELIVQPFDRWLDLRKVRHRFLEDGVRERRGGRVEYFDRFFDSLDREQNARPPSLGEVSRVLERREEKYLSIFNEFLTSNFELPSDFWTEFARFVTWGKETLRDPVAHGHIEIDWEGLRQFRERLLFSFAGANTGALPTLLRARKRK